MRVHYALWLYKLTIIFVSNYKSCSSLYTTLCYNMLWSICIYGEKKKCFPLVSILCDRHLTWSFWLFGLKLEALEVLLCFLLILCPLLTITAKSVLYSMEPYFCIFVFKTITKGFTSVYSDNFNKVIWTVLKIAQVFFIQTFFAQKDKTVKKEQTYFAYDSSACGFMYKMVLCMCSSRS